METQSVEAVKLLSRIEKSLRELIDEAGGSRVDLESNSIALAGRELCWVTVDDQRSLVRHSSALSFDVGDLRRVHADLHRGAWLWSHFWMEAAEGVLHQECDWMREPVIDDEPVMDMLLLSWISFLGIRSGFRSGWQPRLPRITRRLRGGNAVASATVSGGLRRRLRLPRLRGRLVQTVRQVSRRALV